MTNLKRLGRYLKKRPRLVQLFVEQTSTTNVVRLDVYGDSDHAGCLKTRKSNWQLAHDEDWVSSGMCRLVTCRYSNEYSRETFA